MRILVTGATGLLGRALVSDLSSDHEVTGLVGRRSMRDPRVTERSVDLTDVASLREAWIAFAPELVVHTAAMASLEACERCPEQAHEINARVPGDVAELCAEHGAKLVHLSTDAVFSGIGAPYREHDTPDPQSVYAATKLDGERRCLDALPDALVARVNFFGWSASGQRSLAEFFYNSLSQSKPVRGYTDVTFATLYNRDLGQLLVEAAHAGIRGVRHVASSDSMSKFDFGRLLAKTFGFDPKLVQPAAVDELGATVRRSHSLTLATDLLASDLGRSMPTIEDGLRRMRADLESGYRKTLRPNNPYQAGNGATE